MEQDEIKEYIRKIKTELRLSMNGVASAYMRENGLTYKLNFGVEIPRLKALSETLPHNHDLCGKKIFVNVSFWPACYNLQTRFIRK